MKESDHGRYYDEDNFDPRSIIDEDYSSKVSSEKQDEKKEDLLDKEDPLDNEDIIKNEDQDKNNIINIDNLDAELNDLEKKQRQPGDILSSLDTVDEKIDYLVLTRMYLESGKLADPSDARPTRVFERNAPDMEKEFFDSLKMDSEEKMEKVFRTLGRRKAQLDLELMDEYDKQLKKIGKNEPQRETKAYYLARKRHDLDVRYRLWFDLNNQMTDHYMKNQNFKDQVYQRSGLMTNPVINMEGVGKALGYDNSSLVRFYEEEFIDKYNGGKQSAAEHYEPDFGRAKPDNGPGYNRVANRLLKSRLKIWQEDERERFFRGKGYDEKEQDKIEDLRKKEEFKSPVYEFGNKEYTGPYKGNIKDWAKEEDKKEEVKRAQNYKDLEEKYNDYVTKLPSRQENKAIQNSSAQRIEGSEESYAWFVHYKRLNDAYAAKEPTDREKKELAFDTNIDPGVAAQKWLATHQNNLNRTFEKQSVREKLESVIPADQMHTAGWMFTIWALGYYKNPKIGSTIGDAAKRKTDGAQGRKLDISIETISELSNPRIVEEFAEYCKKHPTFKANNRREYETSVKCWMDIFERATEKIKKYKLPAFDFSDPEKTRNDLAAFAKINSLCANMGSEMIGNMGNSLGIAVNSTVENSFKPGAFSKIMETWTAFSELTNIVKMGYLPKKISGNSNEVLQNLSGIAANRMIAEELLKKNAGKNMGEIIAAEKKNLLPMCLAGSNFTGKLYDKNGRRNPKYKAHPEIPRKDLVNYLTGKDKASFRKKFKPLLDQSRKEEKIKIENANCDAHDAFLNNLDFRNMKELILAVPDDDAEAVKNFVNDESLIELDPQKKYRKGEYVSAMFNPLFSGRLGALLAEAGIQNRMDLFLIGGKTPLELWGEKYANVDNPKLREKCLQFEILKKIAAGDTEIRLKYIGLDNEDQPAVKGSRVLLPDTETAKRLEYCRIMHSEHLVNLGVFLENRWHRLILTHPGREKILRHSPKIDDKYLYEMGTVGSGSLRSLEEALLRCVRIIKNKENSRPADIKTALERLQKKAEEYCKINKPLFGTQKPGIERDRVEVAEAITKELPKYLLVYNALRNVTQLDGAFADGCTMVDVPDGKLENRIKQYSRVNLCNGVDTVAKDWNNLGKDLKTNEQYLRNRRYEDIILTLDSGMKQIGKDMTALLKPVKNPDPYDAAVSYYLKSALEKAADRNLTSEQLDQRKTDLDRFIKYGDFQKKADILAKNPVFREFLRKNGTMNYRKWNMLRNESENYVQQLKNDMQTMDGQNKDVARYVLTGLADAGQMKLSAGNLKTNPEETRYNRLDDYVTKQLLTDPKYESVANVICAKYMSYDEIRNNVTAGLKAHNIFEKGKYNDEGRLREMITSGKLKNMVTDTIVRQMTAKAKAQGRQLGAANAPQGAVNQQNNPQAPGMHI